MSNQSQKTIECPYCSNSILLSSSAQRRISFSLGSANLGVNLSVDVSIVTITSYNIHCDFCERSYLYYDFGENYSSILSMLEFDESVLCWLKRHDIHPKDLGDLIVGVVEPKRKVYQNFAKRIRQKFGKLKYKHIEIILRICKDRKEKRCVAAGRMTLDTPHKIKIEQIFWIIRGENE